MKRRDFVSSSLLAAAAAVPGFHVLSAGARTSIPDVTAITGDGRDVTLRSADISALTARLRGQLLLAGDDGYVEARLILNPSFDKHPALIVRPINAADVQAALRAPWNALPCPRTAIAMPSCAVRRPKSLRA